MTILWAGGEDADFQNNAGCTVVTTAGHFRASWARCAINVPQQALTSVQTAFWRAAGAFSSGNFWWGARTWFSNSGSVIATPTNGFLLRFLDGSNVVRLRLIAASNNQLETGNWTLQKVTAAGAATTLVTSTTGFTTGLLQKLDLHINYAVSGQIDIYLDGVLWMTYSGDVTTDSVTALAGFDLGQAACTTGLAGLNHWSEIVVADTDTRSIGLVTLPANGAGATSAWAGTAAGTTINEITLDDTSGLDTPTANNVSLFTQTGTLPTTLGSSLLAVVVSARALTVSGQPQHLDLAIRQGGTVYLSADKAIGTTFLPYQNVWNSNPNSGTAWANADLTTTQFGVKAIT